MSFPGSFGSQLTAIMEALLKAVVAEVTALVEDGAVELRLELRDREQQILEQERDIEERDRVIEELRAAAEELMARREEAVSPEEEEDRQEQNQSCEQEQWTKEEDDTKPFVKSEPTEEVAEASTDPHVSLWPPPSLSVPDTTDAAVATCFEGKAETAHSYSQYSQETEDFHPMDEADLPGDTFQNWNQEPFYSAQQHGFSLMQDLPQLQNSVRNTRKKGLNGKRRDCGTFRCNQCGKTFTVKNRLITHQSVHTGAKPYSCDKCGKKFSRTDSLTRHKRKGDPFCPGNG